MTRLLSFLLMLANAVLAFAVFWLDSDEGQSRMIAVFLAAALAALALLLLLWPRPAILTAARGTAVALILWDAFFALLVMFGVISSESAQASFREKLFLVAFLVIQLVLLLVLLPPPEQRRAERARTGLATILVGIGSLILVYAAMAAHSLYGP